MKKYNFKINKENISSEEIAKFKNFEAVLAGLTTLHVPFYKTKWFIISSAATTIICTAVVVFFVTTTPAEKYNNANSLLSPAFSSVDVAQNEYEIDAENGGEFVYKTGSVISFPKQAFIGANGEKVSGKVKIRYREFRNPKQIFLSGIPMAYDSAGIKSTLESAGMLEIEGYNEKNEKVAIAPEKKVAVQMLSDKKSVDYNVYKLDKKTRNWRYVGKDEVTEVDNTKPTIETLPRTEQAAVKKETTKAVAKAVKTSVNSKLQDEITSLENQLKELAKTKLVKPEPVSEAGLYVTVSLDVRQFPELLDLQGGLWTVDDSKCTFKQEHAFAELKNINVVRKSATTAVITVLHLGTTTEYPARLVFEERAYKRAMNVYNKKLSEVLPKMKEVRMALAQKKAELEESRKPKPTVSVAVRTTIAKPYVYQDPYTPEQRLVMLEQRLMSSANRLSTTEQNVVRSFTVDGFGIWNLDKPITEFAASYATARFIDANNAELQLQKVTVINKKYNSLFDFYKSRTNEFTLQFEQFGENMLMGVTADNKLAYLTYKEFKQLMGMRTSNKPIVLHVLPYEISNTQKFDELYDNGFTDSIITAQASNTVVLDELKVNAYPNPCRDKVTIATNVDEDYKIDLFSYSGSLVSSKEAKGSKLEMQMATVPKGVYLIRVTRLEDNQIATARMMKM